jgi:hypothetical protein
VVFVVNDVRGTHHFFSLVLLLYVFCCLYLCHVFQRDKRYAFFADNGMGYNTPPLTYPLPHVTRQSSSRYDPISYRLYFCMISFPLFCLFVTFSLCLFLSVSSLLLKLAMSLLMRPPISLVTSYTLFAFAVIT